ncbi:MAG: LemA family protein [Firmicutes bacterium]|nr:LemA family protein [Bacillota bacterium]
MIYILIIILVIVLIIGWVISTYNKLVKLRNNIKDQWSQVEVQLKKRFDLIPNLVETVKGYAKHEKETLEAVIDARNSAVNAKDAKEEIAANNELSATLGKLFALGEAYPELKADGNFKQLQDSLSDVEEKIAYARQFYNDSVLKYKNATQVFPTVLIAGMLGFKEEQFFEASEEEKQNVKIEF